MDKSHEPVVLEDEFLQQQSSKGNNSTDNNLGDTITQETNTSIQDDDTKDSETMQNLSDIEAILESCDSSVQDDNNPQFKTGDHKDGLDSKDKSVQVDDKKEIQFKVGASDDEDEMVSEDTSQSISANQTIDDKLITEGHHHDDKLKDSTDLNIVSNNVLLPKQDVCSPSDHQDKSSVISITDDPDVLPDDLSSENQDQTTDFGKIIGQKPQSPSFKPTKPIEETSIDIRHPSEHPHLDTPEPVVAHSSRESNPLLIKTRSTIEDPEEQMIERSEKTPSNPKPAVHEVPNTNILVACLVTICFNLPLGALAIYFSLTAAKAYRDGRKKKGASRARTSMLISLLAIVLTVLAVMFLVLWMAMNKKRHKRTTTNRLSLSL